MVRARFGLLLVVLALGCTRSNPGALDRVIPPPSGPTDSRDLGSASAFDLAHQTSGDLAHPAGVDLARPTSGDLAHSPRDLGPTSDLSILPPCDCTGLMLFSGNQCPISSMCVAQNCCYENTLGIGGLMCDATPTLCTASPTPQ
jgi:hypothetical protein